MNDKFMECITNPVKCKLLLEIHSREKVLCSISSGLQSSFRNIANPPYRYQKDMTGFSLSPLYLSDEELTALITDISQRINTVKKNEPAPERKLRTIGVIVSSAENAD